VTRALAWIGVHDERLARQLRLRPLPPSALRAAAVLSHLNAAVWPLAAAGAAFTGRWRLLLAMAAAMALGQAVLVPLKSRVARVRPCDREPHPHAPAPVHYFAADRASFPSGHALIASLFVTTLLMGWPALGAALVPFLLLVTLSRLALGHHYLSDVVAGLAVGFVAGAAVGRLFLG
jgi:membrane-associated phospholipid phosphatase